MSLSLRPISLKAANAFVAEKHRHHGPDVGHKFSLSVVDGDGKIVGVAVVGRPKARGLDTGAIAEVTRLCTDGTKNACSMLYSAAARICREMGFDAIVTYVLADEPGVSLKASGWACDGVVRRDGKGWNNRPGRQSDNQGPKSRWRKVLKG